MTDTEKNLYMLTQVFLVLFLYRLYLCSPRCPDTCWVDQLGIKLADPPASTLESAGIEGMHHHMQLLRFFFKIYIYFIGTHKQRHSSLFMCLLVLTSLDPRLSPLTSL